MGILESAKIDETLEAFIDGMLPGDEMDMLVAQALGQADFTYLSYSSNLQAAWKIIEWWLSHPLSGGDLFIEWWTDGEWFICDKNLITRKEGISTFLIARSNTVDMETDELPSLPLALCRLFLKKAYQIGLLSTEEMKAKAR